MGGSSTIFDFFVVSKFFFRLNNFDLYAFGMAPVCVKSRRFSTSISNVSLIFDQTG